MAEQSKSKAHLWVFCGLVILAIAVALAGIIISDRIVDLGGQQRLDSDQHVIPAEDDQIAAMIEKHPPLEAWYRFADAAVWSDLDEAMAATCEGPVFGRPQPRKHDINSLSADDLLELVANFEKTYEVILLRAGFVPDFVFVYENAPDHYVIEATWQLDSLSAFGYYYQDSQPDAAIYDEFTKALEKTKDPQEFEFYKIGEQWYYLPQQW